MKRHAGAALAFAFFLVAVNGSPAEARKPWQVFPDLKISAISAPSSTSPGKTIVVSSSILNQGKATSVAFSMSYYLSTTTSKTSSSRLLGVQNVGFLPAGTSVAITTSLAVPPTTSIGAFYVVGVADSNAVVKENNETNNSASSGAMSVKDSTPPTISAVTSSGVTASSTTITWRTDEPSSSQVEYGATTAYGSITALATSMVTSHSVTLSGLTAGSAYHFRVHSKDSAGNSAQSGDVTFTTASPTASAIATTGPTYYVATTGIDANPGTEAQPFRTVSHGVSVLTPGDTLYVKSGTYAEALIHSIPPGATWDRPVTVAAAPGHTVTLRPPPGSEFVLRFIGPQAYIIVRGFILDAVNVTYDAVKITAGPTYVPAHHIRIEDCEIANSRSGHGVLITGDGADFNEILNCRIHHNGNDLAGGSPNHGIYAQSDHNLFEGNDIHDHHEGYGIHLFNASQSFNIVRKNAIHDNVDQLLVTGQGNSVYNNLLWGRGWAIAVCSSSGRCDGNMIYHNTTYATLVGIAVRDTATSTLVQNNIVQQSGGYPDDSIINFGHGTVIQHNLMDRGITNFGSNATIAHNIVGHAWFISAAAHDFRLQPSSPAINAGMTVSLVTEDFEGTPRPQGGSYDIGAFEYSE